ncbi:MAG TPA: hypothetical protein VKU44_10275 [Terriglobia bacterium]|jgi:hypothetical protein|nr:hypothetical protein [Terriglobia bacterium]
MKKGARGTLKLHRETLQSLTSQEVSNAVGGITTSVKKTICSVCISCGHNTCTC